MKTILTVVGARPQFVKASVVSEAIEKAPGLRECLVHTGQHFDANMSQIFFDDLGVRPPDVALGLHGGFHGDLTGRMLIALEKVMQRERPSIVMVYGDTTSTLAAALAASKLHIPVAHIEAGLRSFNRRMPEEINRVLADHLSTWLFTPTDQATRQLATEGINAAMVHQVGDVMFDVALKHAARAEARGRGVLDRIDLRHGRFVLATIHRAENTDSAERLRILVDGLRLIAQRFDVVWPIHPRTRHALHDHGWIAEVAGAVHLIDPQGYLDMVRLERSAAAIITDSGGVQREAFFHRVPCVTVRDESEWMELVSLGWNRLVPPTSPEEVSSAVFAAIGTTGEEAQPYGDGGAASRIVACLTAGG